MMAAGVTVVCTSGEWRAFLTVDGSRVPGAVSAAMPNGGALTNATLQGVTTGELTAGDHVARINLDCLTGALDGGESDVHGAVTFVVLG